MTGTLYLIVHGNVQGVGYRHFVSRAARRLGLAGFVRNESDGSVAVLAEGDAETLDAFVKEIDVDFSNGPSVVNIERRGEDSDKFPAELKGRKFSEFAVIG